MRAASTIAVACGAATGAAARWGILESTGYDGGFPWALLGVNTVGSFVLGAVVFTTASGVRELLRLGVGVGFCGSLTTFSTFAVLAAELGQDGNIATAAAFVVLSVAAAVAAVAVGGAAAKRAAARLAR